MYLDHLVLNRVDNENWLQKEDCRVIANPLIQYWEKSVAFQKCSLGQPPSLWLRQQVSFQSTWSLDHSKVKQLLEASSPIWLISFQIWNLSLDCIGKWREAHLKFDWIARQFPGPIWMNVHISPSYSYAMLCHLSCDLNHEFVPGINLNIRPSAWYTLINYQWTWLLDYSTVKHLLEASSPVWLIWNSSLDCIGEWRWSMSEERESEKRERVKRCWPKNQLNYAMIPLYLGTFTFPLLILTPCFAIPLVSSTVNSCPEASWRSLGHLRGTYS